MRMSYLKEKLLVRSRPKNICLRKSCSLNLRLHTHSRVEWQEKKQIKQFRQNLAFVHFWGEKIGMAFKIFDDGVHVFDNEFASFGRQVHSAQDLRQLDEQPEQVNGAIDKRGHRRRLQVELRRNELPTFDRTHRFVGSRRRRAGSGRRHQKGRPVGGRRTRVGAARWTAAVFVAGRAAACREEVEVGRVAARATGQRSLCRRRGVTSFQHRLWVRIVVGSRVQFARGRPRWVFRAERVKEKKIWQLVL